jgi:hypothetical protein
MHTIVNWAATLLSATSGFLSGALVGTLLTVVVGGLRGRRDRKIACLQEQLRLLYAPASALATQNRQLFQLVEKIQSEHQRLFTGQHSENETRQAALLEASERTTNLGNLYAKRVVKNNTRLMRIIDTNWHLADLSDRDVFSQFQFEYIRYVVETKQRGAAGIPLQIVLELGPVSFMRPDMISRLDKVFLEKQESLERERSRWL